MKIKVAVFCFFIAISLSLLAGCGASEPEHDVGGETASADIGAALENCVRENLNADTANKLESVTAREADGEYGITIKVAAEGGQSFPDVIEQTAAAVFGEAEALAVTISAYQVTEYSLTTDGDIENMISWRSQDGATGTLMDDTNGQGYVETGVTADDLREYFRAIDFGDDLLPYQGEWAMEGRSRYHRLIIADDAVNFVSYDDLDESDIVDSVTTFYFAYDDNGNLVVNNQHGQARYKITLDEEGKLCIANITGDNEPDIYDKTGDGTYVPAITPEPAIGMTEVEVYASTWGAPESKNKTTTSAGVREQWVYEDGYIYFENGFVTAIQEK